MPSGIKLRVVQIFSPFLVVLGFALKVVYNVGFGWWLGPFLDRKAKRALLENVHGHLGFLFTEYGAEFVEADEQDRRTIPFPVVTLHVLCLRLRFGEYRGELHVEIAPDKLPGRFEELSSVLAWWDIKDGNRTSNRSYATWSEIGSILRAELHRINNRLAEES